MIHAPVVFYIWYGGWAGNSTPAILTDLANNIGGSANFGVNGSYFDAGGRVRNSVTFGGSTSVGYSHGTQLDTSVIKQVVKDVLGAGALPVNPDGVYFVLTSADVMVAGISPSDAFCLSFCGWHTRTTFNGTDIKFAFVATRDQCPSACQAPDASPERQRRRRRDGDGGRPRARRSGDPSRSQRLVHRPPGGIEETPTVRVEFRSGIPRAGQSGSGAPVPGGAPPAPAPAPAAAAAKIIVPPPIESTRANMRLGNRDYLIQTNWLNADGGFCALGARRLQVDVTGAGITVDSQPAGISCGRRGLRSFPTPRPAPSR